MNVRRSLPLLGLIAVVMGVLSLTFFVEVPSRLHGDPDALPSIAGALDAEIPLPQWGPERKPRKTRSKKQEQKDKKEESKGSFTRAYEAIKTERLKFVSVYTDHLLDIANRCAKLGLKEQGQTALKRVLLLYKPQESRPRLTKKSAGVVAGENIEGGKIVRKTRRSLSPAEKKQAKKARARYKKIKKALKTATESFADADERKKAITRIESKLAKVHKKFVSNLSKLANSCVDQGFPAQGYEVVQWTLQFDDENTRLRKALRQYRFDDKRSKKTRWYGPYDYAKAKSGYVDHPKYGWITPKDLKKVKNGLARFKGKWHPAAIVETERQEWSNRWVHETAHFEIHTNAPLEDAVYFGREVEKLYSFFFRVWVDFYAPDNAKLARQLVLQGGKDLKSRKLRVHYHRSRESYIWEAENDRRLKTVPNIELTKRSAGFYWGGNGRAYFYREPKIGPNLRTIYHEVTHQIFGETYPDGPRPPVWLVEGLAVFMEDPAVRGDYERGTERFLVGTERPVGVKKNNVRDINRFVKKNFNDQNFHGGGRGDNYKTGGAVVHFFMLYRGGVHRKGFIRYARAAYRNTLEETPTPAKKLYEFLDITEDELQAQWEEFNKKPDLFDF